MSETLATSAAGTVTRIVKLLTSLAEAESEVSIQQLAVQLNLPASTVHRLLRLLSVHGLVKRNPARPLYGPGLELIRIASLLASKIELVDVAQPFMRAAVEECDEVCVLLQYMRARRKVMVLKAEYSSNPLRYQIDRFQPLSLLWGATGRSVLAFLPPEEIEAALADNDVSPTTGESLPPREVMLVELAEIRKRGYAVTHGQKIVSAVGFGAPLFNSEREVIGSLCITLPESRFNSEIERRISSLLLKTANDLNRALGYVPSAGRPK